MPSWQDLMPSSAVQGGVSARVNGGLPVSGFIPGSDGPVGAVGTRWGFDKYVSLGKRALGAYRGWQGAPPHGFMDVSEPTQTDDQELAKMIAQYGAIPADSDLGELAVSAGARTYKQRVKFSDGTYHAIEVVQVGSRKGGADSPEGRAPRSRRQNLTGYRLGTAAWVIRKLHAQQKLGKRLAAKAIALYPRKRTTFGKKKR